MMMLNGMKIIESPLIAEVPRLQLSHGFNDCTPKFKAEMNNWLRQKFGTYMPTYIIGGHTIMMHPSHLALLKLEIGEKK
jgi:hypothetical protein